ncbi:MAG: ribosome recycling factor [Crocinitomicaceae bacterium]
MVEDLQMIYDEFKESNNKSIERLETELLRIRAGKASPAMLNGVMVDYYGMPTPLQQVATSSTMDARTLTIQPFERSMIDEISKGIINANLGFAPQNNGELIIINVPALTEERRRELAKKAKAECENMKVAVRNHRKDAIDMVKDLKNDGLSEDLAKDAEGEIQNITNAYIKKIDELLEVKEKDIMTI